MCAVTHIWWGVCVSMDLIFYLVFISSGFSLVKLGLCTVSRGRWHSVARLRAGAAGGAGAGGGGRRVLGRPLAGCRPSRDRLCARRPMGGRAARL